MKPITEQVRRDARRSFNVMDYASDTFDYPWHRHAEHELTWIGSGEGQRYVGDNVESFGPGEVVLLAGGLPHAWLAPRGEPGWCRSVVVQFRDDAFGGGFFDLPELRGVRGLLHRAERGVWFGADALDEDAGVCMQRLACAPGAEQLIELVSVLTRLASAADGAGGRLLSSAPWAQGAHEGGWLDELLATIQERYREPLTLEGLAATVHRSPSAVGRGFSKVMGCTVVDYLHQLRVAEACRLLTHTRQPVTEVAHASGFNNLAHFGRVFKRQTGTTPRQYRRASHEA